MNAFQQKMMRTFRDFVDFDMQVGVWLDSGAEIHGVLDSTFDEPPRIVLEVSKSFIEIDPQRAVAFSYRRED